MNFGKLLAVGKGFLGGRGVVAYRKDKHVYLPKFTSAKKSVCAEGGGEKIRRRARAAKDGGDGGDAGRGENSCGKNAKDSGIYGATALAGGQLDGAVEPVPDAGAGGRADFERGADRTFAGRGESAA
jgi:hypothetical protein